MHKFLRKIQVSALGMCKQRERNFRRALLDIENIFEDIRQDGTPTWRRSRDASMALGRILIYYPEFYMLAFGMAILAIATNAFTVPGVAYDIWQPISMFFAAIWVAALSVCIAVLTFPIHTMYRVNTWVLYVVNVVITANIFALTEPYLARMFYTDGVLEYPDLIIRLLVFSALGHGYLQLRLNTYYCFNCYLKRHQTPNINSLVPADKRGKIISLSAQDHYVEIVTEKGRHLSRMPMKKAVSMVPDRVGMQVHRSHWAAFAAMLTVEKEAERHILVLRNGARLPVSKAKLAELQAYLESRAR